MDDITEERQTTHGSFKENAEISQGIKRVMHSSSGWDSLSADKKESLEMIALKISRILSGHGNFKDHWTDVKGYASLIEKVL